jgi:hypothetical protein
MSRDSSRWTLEDLIDFESGVSVSPDTPDVVREAVVSETRGLTGVAARRAGFRKWLDLMGPRTEGRKFMSALAVLGSVGGLLVFLAGISAVVGLVDRARGGIHITLFLAVLIGVQWLLLVLAGLAWCVRGRASGGFSGVQAVLGGIARRISGGGEAPWWGRLMHDGGAARSAVLWRLARMAQASGVCFNLGLLAGLGGMILVRHIGFFWETTTELAMHSLLGRLSVVLSAPWSFWWPGAVPDAAAVDAARWVPGRELAPGPAVWWEFLLMVTLVWGLLPRLVLWLLSWRAGRVALGRLDFQARCHRVLWRELTGAARVDADDKPLDGVLVLDVGGTQLTEVGLNAFLLRRMRVHPAAWHSVAVMDPGAEAEASTALTQAPAGVVLLSEGWALSPPQMSALHAKIRDHAGPGAPIKFLVANSGDGGVPVAPSGEERREWERFVDSLRDAEAEVFFYEEPQLGV